MRPSIILKRDSLSRYISLLCNRRMAVMVLLGFSSGLPLPLTSGTLQAWLTIAGIDLRTIGVFSLVGLPYTLKFLWSPFMDRFVPPWLGRRRGWIIITQFSLMLGITSMVLISPQHAPLLLAILAFTVAFLSASQDVVVDAYRTDILPQVERGIGVATFLLGYRVAMLVAGAFALILSDRVGWQNTYFFMAGLLIVGVWGTLIASEPDGTICPPKTLHEAIWGPLKDFFSRPMALIFLLLIVLYKLGDAYAGTLTTAFLLRGVHFTATDVGTINKGMGLIATIAGAMFGGTLMVKLGLFRSLLIFGVLQMISNLSFMVLAWVGKNYGIMIFAVAFENLSGGMGSAAFVALIMALCNKRYSATQFSLLSSIAVIGRICISPTSGFMVEIAGWPLFFFITTLTAIPGLWLLLLLRKEIFYLQQQ
ncbi:MAG TPA: muropeptide transporter AmpG [Deltaproteobacteria bacterium]|nr:muropeptide transporter AmpG [Deltaproteobacteria bacterium]